MAHVAFLFLVRVQRFFALSPRLSLVPEENRCSRRAETVGATS